VDVPTMLQGASAATARAGGPRAAATDDRSYGFRRAGRRAERGQLTFDFAIGMGVFLLSLTFVFTFVPGMLAPFDAGAQTETPAANRVADDLTQRRLGSAGEPYVLDVTCTRELFTAGAPSECAYSGSSLADRVGVLERTPVNVSIYGNPTDTKRDKMLCWDATTDGVVRRGSAACGDDGGDVVLSGGSDPAGSGGKTVSATRVARLDGQDVTVEVVMW